MKNVVSIIATFALLTLFSVSAAFGQTTSPEAGAVMIGAFQASFAAKDAGVDLNPVYGVESTVGGVLEVVAWMTSGGKTVYTLDLNTVEFYGPCEWAKTLSLPTMMDMFARGVVRKGIEYGYTQLLGENDVADVYYASCVTRQETGCTHLTPAPQTAYNINRYNVSGTHYSPVISLNSIICTETSCSGSFQSTCGTVQQGQPPIKLG